MPLREVDILAQKLYAMSLMNILDHLIDLSQIQNYYKPVNMFL